MKTMTSPEPLAGAVVTGAGSPPDPPRAIQVYRVQNLTPYTHHCEYCGRPIKPGKWHECDGLYPEQREAPPDAD